MTDDERIKYAALDQARQDAERQAYIAALEKAKAELQAAADESGNISILNTYRFLVKSNRQITYRGLNCCEIQQLRKHLREQWQAIKERHKRLYATPRFLERNLSLVLIGVTGVIAIIAGGKYAIAGALVLGFIWHVLDVRTQRESLFVDTYDAAFADGIDHALGIGPTQREEIADRAIQMEIDEGVLAGLERREAEASLGVSHA